MSFSKLLFGQKAGSVRGLHQNNRRRFGLHQVYPDPSMNLGLNDKAAESVKYFLQAN
jgi:hypothetical protein